MEANSTLTSGRSTDAAKRKKETQRARAAQYDKFTEFLNNEDWNVDTFNFGQHKLTFSKYGGLHIILAEGRE